MKGGDSKTKKETIILQLFIMFISINRFFQSKPEVSFQNFFIPKSTALIIENPIYLFNGLLLTKSSKNKALYAFPIGISFIPM